MSDVELDYVVSTGDYIEEWLDDNGLSQAELARRMGCSAKHVSKLIHGSPLTNDMALRLARVTGVPADRWMQIETFYRSELSRLELEQDPQAAKAILRQLPLKFLRDHGYLTANLHKPGRCAFEALAFYRAGTLDALREQIAAPAAAVAFRQGRSLDWAARMTWLRLVEVKAAKGDELEAFDRQGLADRLAELRALTRRPPAEYGPALASSLAEVGVRLVFAYAVPRAGTYGAARWFQGSPLVALSLHRKSEDQLWFTLFHELFHVLNHELTPEGFVSGEWGDGRLEQDADDFAGDFLIPPVYGSRLGGLTTAADVQEFAEEIGISPGIVVGRLHREGLWDYSQGNALIQRLVLAEADEG